MADTYQEDEGIILRTIGKLYCELIRLNARCTHNEIEIAECKKKIRKNEELLDGEVVPMTYQQKVVNLYNDYEEVVYFLAKNSNESISDIKKMSLGERMKFQQLMLADLRRKKPREQ